jgi:hypothetical protein
LPSPTSGFIIPLVARGVKFAKAAPLEVVDLRRALGVAWLR